MSEAKHTPGPWHVLLSNGAAFEIGDDSDANKANILCTRYKWEERAAEMLANIRLMAAAPDMLDVLQRIAEYADDATPIHPSDNLIVDVRAAIAKATGSAA